MSGVISKQGQFLLKHKWHAMGTAIALALFSYTSWLAVSIIALVTLRRGSRDGAWLLAPVMIVNLTITMLSVSPTLALVNTVLLFIPCYLAACVLRSLESWQAVAWFFILLVSIAMLLVQSLMPDFLMLQYRYLQTVLSDIDTSGPLLAFLDHKTGLNQLMIASYFLGLQTVGVMLSAVFSLSFARSVQSELFYPGGFKREMLAFRGDKIALLLFALLFIAARQQSVLAMSLLPVLIFYFLLAGLSLSLNVFTKQKPRYSAIFMMVSLLIVPFIMLPVYVLFGSLDSLFNFRLYLPSKAAKTL